MHLHARCHSSVECTQLMTLNFVLDDPWTQGTHHRRGLCSWWTLSRHLLKHWQPHFLLAGKRRCDRIVEYTAWCAGKGFLVHLPVPSPSLQQASSVYCVLTVCPLLACTEGSFSNLERGGPALTELPVSGSTGRQAGNYSTGATWAWAVGRPLGGSDVWAESRWCWGRVGGVGV